MGDLFCVAPKYRSRSTQPSNDNDEQFSLPYTIFRAWKRNYHGTGNNLLTRSQSRNLRYLPQILRRKETLCCEFELRPIVLGVRPCGVCGLPYPRRSRFRVIYSKVSLPTLVSYTYTQIQKVLTSTSHTNLFTSSCSSKSAVKSYDRSTTSTPKKLKKLFAKSRVKCLSSYFRQSTGSLVTEFSSLPRVTRSTSVWETSIKLETSQSTKSYSFIAQELR